MITNFDKKMISDFMERHYPVSRIKVNQRFRRAILLDNGAVFILGEKENHQSFKTSLINILSEIFYIDNSILTPLVDGFLSSK
jgi:hypothetical protein